MSYLKMTEIVHVGVKFLHVLFGIDFPGLFMYVRVLS